MVAILGLVVIEPRSSWETYCSPVRSVAGVPCVDKIGRIRYDSCSRLYEGGRGREWDMVYVLIKLWMVRSVSRRKARTKRVVSRIRMLAWWSSIVHRRHMIDRMAYLSILLVERSLVDMGVSIRPGVRRNIEGLRQRYRRNSIWDEWLRLIGLIRRVI